jgi:hypothetical protein
LIVSIPESLQAANFSNIIHSRIGEEGLGKVLPNPKSQVKPLGYTRLFHLPEHTLPPQTGQGSPSWEQLGSWGRREGRASGRAWDLVQEKAPSQSGSIFLFTHSIQPHQELEHFVPVFPL